MRVEPAERNQNVENNHERVHTVASLDSPEARDNGMKVPQKRKHEQYKGTRHNAPGSLTSTFPSELRQLRFKKQLMILEPAPTFLLSMRWS